MHINYNRLAIFLFLLALLSPIVWVATWGVRHSRPILAQLKVCEKNGTVYVLGTHYRGQNLVATCLNAKTGDYTSVSMPRQNLNSLSTGFDGKELWTSEVDDKGHHQIFVVSVPDMVITASTAFEDDRKELDVCVVGHSVVKLLADFVTVESIETRENLDSMKLGFAGDGTLEQMSGTRNVLASAKRTTTGAIRDFVLLSVHDGKLAVIARWQALDCKVNDEHTPRYITSLLPDGLTVQTIDATDGKLLCSNRLPDNFGLRLPLSSLEGDWNTNWNQWNHRDSGGMNLISGAILKTPENGKVIWHDEKRHRFFCVEWFSYNDRQFSVRDEETGSELFRIPLPVPYYFADSIEIRDNQLLFATRDCRIAFFDVASGSLLRTVDPFRTVHWVNCFCCIVFGSWCALWSRLSTSMHAKGWIDLAAYVIPVLGYVFLRLQNQTFDRFSMPPISIVSFGITMGLAILASIWWSMGSVRWSIGAIPCTLCTLFGLGFHSYTIGRSGVYTPDVIEAVVTTSIAASGFTLFLKRSSFRFCLRPNDQLEYAIASTGSSRNTIPLRDFFLWTAVFGIYFAMLKAGLCVVRPDVTILLLAIPLGLFLAVVAAIALWLAMHRSASVASRAAKISCGIAILCVVFADPAGTSTLPSTGAALLANVSLVPVLMPVWLTVYLGLYAYRLRG